MTIKFIHAADLHIDSPLRGLDAHDGAPVEQLRSATRRAFVALVDLAIEQRVALVVLAGDIYDGNWTDFRTGLFFREQLRRLVDAGIRVFIARGNHDAESQITKQLPQVDGVHVFSHEECETVTLDDLGVAVHGYSFPSRAVSEDVVPRYPQAIAGVFNIGVLHTSLTGRIGHDTYAPTTVEALCSKGYDYFALGHVHAREIVREAHPRIVYPGNLQGRKASETGPKGCELITIDANRIVDTQFVALDVVRWHRLTIEAAACASLDGLLRAFHREAALAVGDATDRMHALRVLVTGESELHRIEAEQPGTINAAIIAAVQDYAGAELWLEKVKLELRSPVDREQARQRGDAVAEVIGLVDDLLSDDKKLADWVLRHLDTMAALPAGLAEHDPANLDVAAMRAALSDAEATVLAQLGSIDTVLAPQATPNTQAAMAAVATNGE